MSIRAASWVRTNHDDDSRLHDFVTADGYAELRNWQADCFNQLKDSQYSLVCTPTGAGKTTAIASIIAHKMMNDKRMKTVIVVPQFSVAKGFLSKNFILPDGQRVSLEPFENLAFDLDDKYERFIDWISRKSFSQKDINDRVLICCTATYVNAMNVILKSRRRREILSNLVTVLDEAHHSRTDEENDETNQLGRIIQSMYSASKKKEIVENHVIMATATFYRGDKCQIISDEMKENFQRFDMAWDTWLSQMNHLKSFTYNYVFESPANGYYDGLSRSVDDLFLSGKRKLIIYLPQVKSIFNHYSDDKYEQVQNIVNILAEKTRSKVCKTDDGLIVLRNGDQEYKILDLVDERDRKRKKEFFERTDINANKDAIDCVIALNMFAEGSDWQHADGMIITGYRDSLTDLIQRIGRVLRDVPGKETAKIIQILPYNLLAGTNEDMKDTLNNRYKTLASAMLMEDFFNPEDAQPQKKDRRGESTNERKSVFASLPLDENGIKTLFVEVTKLVHEKAVIFSDLTDQERVTRIRGSMAIFVKRVLGQLSIKNISEDDYGILGEEIWRKFCRHKLVSDGVDMSRFDWEMIDEVDPVGHLLKFVSQPTDGDALSALRSMIAQARIESLEIERMIEELDERPKFRKPKKGAK